MKRFLFMLTLLLASSTALAADHPVSCQGASCKITVETRTSGNVKTVAAQFDGTGVATLAPAAADADHVANGNLEVKLAAANADYMTSTNALGLRFSNSGGSPAIDGNSTTNTQSMFWIGSATLDTGTAAISVYDSRIWAASSGGQTTVGTRPLFSWRNNNTEKMSMSAAGQLSIPNATNATSAITGAVTTTGGISAAQQIWTDTTVVAKTGVKFKDTGSGSTTVSWYEDPTIFTSTLTPATGAFGSLTYTQQKGAYSRVGRIVHVQWYLEWSAATIGTASGALRINLPYTVYNNSNYFNAIACSYQNLDINGTATRHNLTCITQPNTQFCIPQAAGDAITAYDFVAGDAVGGSFNKYFLCGGSYLSEP